MGIPYLWKNCYRVHSFSLVYGLESVLPIECEILSLKLAIELLPNTFEEEKHFLYLAQLDETRRIAALAAKAQKKCVKD